MIKRRMTRDDGSGLVGDKDEKGPKALTWALVALVVITCS